MSSKLRRDIMDDHKYWDIRGEGTINSPFSNITDVFIQDQSSFPITFYFSKSTGTATTLTAAVAVDDFVFPVTSVANISAGNWVRVINDTRYMWGLVLDVTDLNVTIDSPIDHAFTSGSSIEAFTRDIGVNGAVTPQTFVVDSAGPLALAFDITRLAVVMITDTQVTMSAFGDLTALTNGIILRHKYADGTYKNIFNVKNNFHLSMFATDKTFYDSTHPVQDVNGLTMLYTFNGQGNHGVVIRIEAGGQLELIVQDDLSGLTLFNVAVQGHEVV